METDISTIGLIRTLRYSLYINLWSGLSKNVFTHPAVVWNEYLHTLLPDGTGCVREAPGRHDGPITHPDHAEWAERAAVAEGVWWEGRQWQVRRGSTGVREEPFGSMDMDIQNTSICG